MSAVGSFVSWLVASAVAYVLASMALQWVVLSEQASLLAAAGASLPAGSWREGLIGAVGDTVLLMPVIAVAFLIAFFVASLVKAMVPFLSPIAYPVAGGAAIATAIILMPIIVPGNYELQGAHTSLGLGLQMASGAVGGLVFELFRPKED